MSETTGRCRRHHQNQCEGPTTKGLCVKHRAIWEAMQDDWKARAKAAGWKPNQHPVVETCTHGHPYTPENTCITKTGRRRCRTCQNLQSITARAKKKTTTTTQKETAA